MTHRIIMPDLGQATAEGKILRWLKQPGDKVGKGESLVEIETDKAVMEVESYAEGYLREWLVNPGQRVSALEPIAIMTTQPDAPFSRTDVDRSPLTTMEVSGVAAGSDTSSIKKRISPASLPQTEPAGKTIDVHNSPAEPAYTEASIPPELKLKMYERMLACRAFEDRVYYMFLEGRLPGTVHQSQGQEASAVGVCSALVEGDMITSTHRPHSHAVARGLSLSSLMAELFAKQTGCCGGKGGSMHLGDAEAGMLPAIAIVGGGIPLAAGYALAMQYLKKPNITACFFGDGATNIGTFHEAINMAAVWDLPIIFVCENNKYGASTSVHKVMKIKNISERAAAYGIPGLTVDGNDVEKVYRAAMHAAERARRGGGPTLLELETYRFAGHSRSDPGHYRPQGELDDWKRRDPISHYEQALRDEGVLTEESIAQIKSSIERDLDEAVRFAESSPAPQPEDALTDVYAD